VLALVFPKEDDPPKIPDDCGPVEPTLAPDMPLDVLPNVFGMGGFPKGPEEDPVEAIGPPPAKGLGTEGAAILLLPVPVNELGLGDDCDKPAPPGS